MLTHPKPLPPAVGQAPAKQGGALGCKPFYQVFPLHIGEKQKGVNKRIGETETVLLASFNS